ncbi:hypothetical protein [Streptomyces sp. CBMA123]|uniref:hypothetical protein n=1 Tax=Streptomyces sp. CBMA123 TaxID=1896313 RepID=UPI001661E164|nr:hypothetical protein [Streptomyces sp. CBMA123]MBD0690085.1 hypothetical protein [Streptomyces sp. CBMA123]
MTPRPHEDLVLWARVRLLSRNRWELEGEEAMRVYRILFAVTPHVHASKLTQALLGLSYQPRLAHLPEARRALLREALEAAAHIPPGGPWYQDRYAEYALSALRRLDEQDEQEGQNAQEG